MKNKSRVCPHKQCAQIFEHNFCADKAKTAGIPSVCRGFLTQYARKFAKKMCAMACADRL